MRVKKGIEMSSPHRALGHILQQQSKQNHFKVMEKLTTKTNLFCTLLNILSRVNVVIWLFRPMDDMGHVGCDTADMAFRPMK